MSYPRLSMWAVTQNVILLPNLKYMPNYNKSNTLATSWEELTHWKRPWCWEGLGAGGEGDDRGWDGWMASPTRGTWVCVDSGSWWWTGRPGELWFMGSQRVGHDWATELNWTEGKKFLYDYCVSKNTFVLCIFQIIEICISLSKILNF